MIDPSQRVVRLFSDEGQPEGRLLDTRGEGFYPGTVAAVPDDGFLLKQAGPQAVRLSGRLEPQGGDLDLSKTAGGNKSGLGALYDWTLFKSQDQSYLVGYGSVRNPPVEQPPQQPLRQNEGQQFQLGFVLAEMNGTPGSARLLKPSDAPQKQFDDTQYYVFGHKYVATNELGAFVLAMDKTAVLYRVNPESSTLEPVVNAIPKDFRKVPQLKTENTGPSSTEPLYRELETLSIPVGIYGQGKKIYLLTRENPTEAGEGTIWSMYPIDPGATGAKVLGEALQLPTHFPHLAVVPAGDKWFFIEKGHVEAWGRQKIDSMIEIPAGWFSSPQDSPLLAARLIVEDCAPAAP
jgi:hypothetical protein